MTNRPTATALILIFDGVEELEAVAPIDILRRAGVAVTVASLAKKDFVLGRNAIKIVPDTCLADVDPAAFTAFILPGGPGVMDLVENPDIRQILQQRNERGQLIAAICAAPKVLAAAGVLDDRYATSHAAVTASIPNHAVRPVVVDRDIVTSQGAGTAVAFSLEIAAKLTDPETAAEVAKSIHA